MAAARRGRLGEALFAAYRLLWWAGLALMVVVNLYAAPRAEWIDRDMADAAVRLGLGTPVYPSPSPEGETVAPFGAAGKGLGMQGGEWLVAVDGRPLPQDKRARIAALSGSDGVPVALTFRREDGSTHRARIVRSPSYERAEFAGSLLGVATRRLVTFLVDLFSRLVGLVAALILFLRRPRDPVAMLFCVAMLLNAFPVNTRATMWPGLGGVLVVAIAQFSLVLTGLLFPHGRMRTPWHWLALLVAIGTLYVDVAVEMDYWLPFEITPLRFFAVTLSSLATLLAAVVADYRATPRGVARQQFKPVAFGSGLWIAFYIAGNIDVFFVAPLFTGVAARAWLTLIEWACYSIAWMGLPVGLLVGLSRYRLYDADSAISRSVAYLSVTLVLLLTFEAVQSAVVWLSGLYLGQDFGTLSGLWGAIVSAMLLKPVHKRAARWADRQVRGGLIALGDDLPERLRDLRDTETAGTIAAVVLEAVEKGTHAQHGAIAMTGGEVIGARHVDADRVRDWMADWKPTPLPKQRMLSRDDGDLLFPIRMPLRLEKIEGWLLVGPRPDHSPPGRDEREVLLKIAKPVGRAIAVARARETLEHGRVTIIDLIHDAIAGLSGRIDRLEAMAGHDRGDAATDGQGKASGRCS